MPPPDESPSATTAVQSGWLLTWLPPVLLSAVSLAFITINYLAFHTVAELISIVIAFTALIVAVTSRKFTRNNHIIFISILFGWCAAVDLFHTLNYRGMSLWIQDNGNAGIQFWIVARSMQALGLLIAPVFLVRRVSEGMTHFVLASITGLFTWLILAESFPEMYVSETGLTATKIAAEIVIIVVLGLAWVWHRKNRHLISANTLRFLGLSIAATMLSELLFTQYVYVDDSMNMTGHVLKIFAYWFIYMALVHQTLQKPFDVLTRAASTYDAVPDPTLVVNRNGVILQANAAAGRAQGRPPADLVGLPSHSLFHPEGLKPEECPVCEALQKAQYRTLSIDLRPPVVDAPTAVTISPLDLTIQEPTFVEVVRNVGETYLREQAQALAAKSQARFREIFEFSPAPMQIYLISTGELIGINRAFTNWIGYQASDIPRIEDWFQKAYPNGDHRAEILKLWQSDVAAALRSDDTIRSPQLTLRAKDGRLLVAQGSITAAADEVIVTWNDLTEIKETEKALIESENHFRSMMENSAAGMYVRRANRFVYVNPAYCDMLGYTKEELIGLDVFQITKPDPEFLKQIYAAWETLDKGAPSVTYRVPVQHKDGRYLTLELFAKPIEWDGAPAHIVLAQDITLREQQRQQIETYVKQLEGSMQSTLEAVAQMVEMRDPYTAGHERRVGLIARDIALEMGWEPARAEPLALIGLVHDIGKIAVPAEILTKPTRLNPLEMELVRGHAQAGYDILKGIPFPTPVAEVVYQHHERMDGSGYPRALKGDEILPEARILAVADVMESIGSHRPYRAARGIEASLKELRDGRGTIYDPAVVDAALRLVEQKQYQLPSIGAMQ